ncbi:hypothetical protein [Paractinoplanes hotanensis]|uniref:Uncharacterized protein n=1 Tax=Paractinoplanes hotanensis TaxID=2906497 RepID=A0ABT0XWW0_9ACTN|nr:hypothetical protein [Actinoplanes hotanensis]MCM4078280.1 hypothetical protein [Actinoplanes hotanensis]
MSLYSLSPKPGCERYTIQVGWNPHRTLFCTVADFGFDPDTDPGTSPDFVQLGLLEQVLDTDVIVAAVEPYAVIPDDLVERLEEDMINQGVYRREPDNRRRHRE